MTLEKPNVLVHEMKGTEGGKDSICWREFLKEKMKCTCKVRKNTCCHSPYKWISYFCFFFLRWTTLSPSGCTTEFNDLPPTLAARGPIVPQARHFHFVTKKKIQFLLHPISSTH